MKKVVSEKSVRFVSGDNYSEIIPEKRGVTNSMLQQPYSDSDL